jgi:hypothetical protein
MIAKSLCRTYSQGTLVNFIFLILFQNLTKENFCLSHKGKSILHQSFLVDNKTCFSVLDNSMMDFSGIDMEYFEPKIMLMTDGPRYVCSRCGVKYKKGLISTATLSIKLITFLSLTVSALRSHARECGVGAQCPLCPKVVTQKRNLAKHMEKHKRDGLWQHASFNIIKDEIHI